MGLQKNRSFLRHFFQNTAKTPYIVPFLFFLRSFYQLPHVGKSRTLSLSLSGRERAKNYPCARTPGRALRPFRGPLPRPAGLSGSGGNGPPAGAPGEGREKNALYALMLDFCQEKFPGRAAGSPPWNFSAFPPGPNML